jgi:YihY family inner membrane protein
MPRPPVRAAFGHFFRERGTHLAAMVAYFALLSFVPLIFLALAALGYAGQGDEQSALVSYLRDIFPGQSVQDIVRVVRAVERNAGTLSIVGAVGLLWSSLSLFSALESVFNILYGRPNRGFLRGKGLALSYMAISMVVLFSGLTVGTFGFDLLRRYAGGAVGNGWVALGLTLLSTAAALFLFLFSAYFRLTNARLTRREVLPGAIVGAIVLAVTIQGLPLFVALTGEIVALQALGATFLLLVWLYVMANVIVFGASLNFEWFFGSRGRLPQPKHPEPEPAEEETLPHAPRESP